MITNQVFGKLVFRALRVFASADGVLDAVELDQMRRVARAHGVSLAEDWAAPVDGSPQRELVAIADALPPTPLARRTLYRECVFLCLSDGEMADEERDLLAYLAQKLDVSEALASAFQEWCGASIELNQAGLLLLTEGELALQTEETDGAP